MAIFPTGLEKLGAGLLGQAMPMIDPNSISNSISNNAYNRWGPIQAGISGNAPTVGGVISIGSGQGIHTQYYLPPATGITLTMAFVDANGIAMTIAVDQSYTGIMSQISNLHQMKRNGGVNAYCPPPIKNDGPIFKQKTEPMVGGDFSYDEMKLAETIIQELESGEKDRVSHKQEDIDYLK